MDELVEPAINVFIFYFFILFFCHGRVINLMAEQGWAEPVQPLVLFLNIA